MSASQVLRRTLWAVMVGVAAAWMVGTILSGQHGGAQSGAVGSAVRDAQTGSIGQVKVASEVVYVVQPGDTLWSIAHRLDPAGDERPLVDRLASQLHGASIYPGETIQVPDH
ncbi:MAG: LysM peptidoglycan-binding domain-containing protein [Acidimicrobiales bacterium]